MASNGLLLLLGSGSPMLTSTSPAKRPMNPRLLCFAPLLGHLFLVFGCLSSTNGPSARGGLPNPEIWIGWVDERPQTGWTDHHRVLWLGDTAFQHPAQLPQFFHLVHEMGIDSITEGSARDTELTRD